MDQFATILATLGPVGILAAGFLGVVAWVARMSAKAAQQYERVHSRLDNLDHHEKGRVPIVERRVDDIVDNFNDLHTDVEVIKNDTRWIREALTDGSPSPAAGRAKRKANS
jgi:hypothetical protein